MRYVLLAVLVWSLLTPLACGPSLPAQPNFLVVVADDVGVDRVGAYADHPDLARTPTIDSLAGRGVLFRQAWACPVCSPTRAALLTGRYPFRTGIGRAIQDDPFGLPLSEITLPEALEVGTAGQYTSVALGKWHLGSDEQGLDHPRQSGFLHHMGTFKVLEKAGDGGAYFNWKKVIDGVETDSHTYATTDTTDDAIRMVRSLPEPWFLYVCYDAAHRPFHAPPDDLHTYDLQGDPLESVPMHYRAMVEAMDTELGRLLSSFPEAMLARTNVVFLGDNGTPVEALDPAILPEHAKGTLYEGGVHVPLIFAGPAVQAPGRECRAIVSVVDVFATVLELADVNPHDVVPSDHLLDSKSLVPFLRDPDHPPIHSSVLAETFTPNGFGLHELEWRGIRGDRYKLVRRKYERGAVVESFFDLVGDRLEQHDLLRDPASMSLEERAELRGLRKELRDLLGS